MRRMSLANRLLSLSVVVALAVGLAPGATSAAPEKAPPPSSATVAPAAVQTALYNFDQVLHGEDTKASDEFGCSVDIDGDTAVVGAYVRNSYAGGAYAWKHELTGWVQQQIVVGTDTAAGDEFGHDVAVSGDTMVVGAPTEGTGGAVYVFTRTGETWTQSAKIAPGDLGGGAFFGYSVDLSADTLVVGAWNAGACGAVYVFTGSGANWVQQGSRIEPVDLGSGGNFGASVALSGDTLLVGAVMAEGTGAAFAYARSAGAWSLQQRLTPDPIAMGYQYGQSVAIEGDYAVVGAPRTNSDAGSAYVFNRSGTTWTQQKVLTGSDTNADDWFGWSVAIHDSLIYVGAYQKESYGRVYEFWTPGTWLQMQTYAPMSATGLFGHSIAASDDTLFVGAPWDAANGLYSGAVWAYTTNTPPEAFDDTYDVAKGTALAVSVEDGLLSNDHDDDDDPFTVSNVTAASHGTRQVYNDGHFTYTPNPGYTGPDSFSYLVRDEHLKASGLATVHLNVIDVLPQAADDSYTVAEDSKLTVNAPGVLGNDVSGDADALDVDYAGMAQPQHGTITWLEGGGFTYEPDLDFFGTDSFQYIATDGETGTGATVNINVTPVAEYLPLQGSNRFATAANAALSEWGDTGSEVVILATGRNFPDALGGAALAGMLDAPLLLVDTNAVPAEVTSAIKALGAKYAIILGGEATVGSQVEKAVKATMGTGAEVDRIGGRNRYETARWVADAAIGVQEGDYDGTAFVATGLNFPDALGAGAISAWAGWPVYLVGADESTTIDEMKAAGVSRVKVLGGEKAVSKATYSALAKAFPGNVERIAGSDRYDTAGRVADLGPSVGMTWQGVGLATGASFPDALAAGPVLGRAGAPLLLSTPSSLSEPARGRLWTNRASISTVRFFGGTSALSNAVRTKVRQTTEAP